jgi:hypothetical protein
MKKYLIIAAIMFLAGCSQRVPSSTEREAHMQEQLSAESVAAVGMPSVTNFQEKRMMKMIIEMRDKALTTITYTQDMNGNLHKLCDSVGYGLPYATQYTNPQKIGYAGSQVGVATLPQADPNGLFSPPAADGTWILCLDPATKNVSPIYSEPHIIVSQFPLK